MPGNFDPSTYVSVNDRIQEFWKKNPEGSITTEMVHLDGPEVKHRMVVLKATVYTTRTQESVPASVGYAKEREGTGGANRTAFIENAETSAIGRALANFGYLIEKGRPSREEIEAVVAHDQEVLRQITSLALEADDATRTDVKKNWKQLKTNPDFAVEYLTELQDKLGSQVTEDV